MKQLALTIPGSTEPIPVPQTIPTLKTTSLQNLAGFFFELIVLLGIIAALVFVIYSGIAWITSGGDKQKVEKAKGTLTYAIVGLIVIVLSFVTIRIVGTFLNSELLINFGNFGIAK